MFTWNGGKKAVARIIGGKRDGHVVYLTDDEMVPDPLQCATCGKKFARRQTLAVHLGNGVISACKGRQIHDIKGGGGDASFDSHTIDDGGVFQVLPGFSGERDVLYTAAPSGSGKSVWVSKYLQELPANMPIFLFSGIEDDPAFDKIKHLKQIKFDQEFVDSPIDIKELHDSCCIFDDTGKLKQPYRDICQQLQDELLEKGRHFRITTISTNHLSTDGGQTRNLINESSSLVVFPKASSLTETERILHKYVGFPKKLIPKLQQLGGRSVYVHKNFPQFILSDKKVAKPDPIFFG